MAEPIHAPTADRRRRPGAEVRRLGALVGRWRTEGHVVGQPAVPITGTDSFTARAFDNQGAVTVMRVSVDDQGVWRFTGGADVAAAAQPSSADPRGAVRSTLTVSEDATGMTARWERSDDGSTWQPWMNVIFTRLPGP